MTHDAFDVVIVGGGPAGYVAALRARQLGLSAALVERAELGGVCLNWGCIPTKSLLRTADLWRQLSCAGDFGIRTGEMTFDFAKVIERSRDVAARLNQGVRHLLHKAKVGVVAGRASLRERGTVQVVDDRGVSRTLRAADIVIATGARPRDLPGAAADGDRVWTSRHALAATRAPRSLLVVGAGAIGMEFASFFSTFGTRVSVVEAADRVLPLEDAEVSAFVEDAYRAQGIELHTRTSVTSLRGTADGVAATVRTPAGAQALAAERVLIAVGVVGNTEDLGLEALGVPIERGHVVVAHAGDTGVAGVHAIGDVAGPPWLAHKAMHAAVACIDRIAGRPAHLPAADVIPSCTYGHPQTASVGLTEAAALAQGRSIRVGRFPFRGNGKAIAMGDAQGFVKTIVDADSGELLGAHCAGPDVTELIHSFGMARVLEATVDELVETVFPHPTLSEGLHESLLAALGRALHL